MSTRKITDTNFDKAMDTLVKQFGDGCAHRPLSDGNYKAIPTGHDDLDALLTKGAHGIFLGGVIELFGSEGAGKSSVALRTVGNAQKLGYRCAWFDCEAGFDVGIAKLNGVNTSTLVLPELAKTTAIKKSDTETDTISILNAYEVLEMVYQFVATNVFGLIVLDSVAGLMPERILSDNFDPNKSAAPAEVARALSDMLRKIAPACQETETSVIFINQKRDQPGAYMVNPNHTPGGRALKFFAHQRISVEKIGGDPGRVWAEIDGKNELIGHYARTKIVKNKKAPPVPPGVEIHIPIYYREYFPNDTEKCYTLARSLQVIKIRQGVLTWKEEGHIIIQENGESTFISKLKEQNLLSRLARACVDAIASSDKDKTIPKSIQELSDSYKAIDSESDEKKTDSKKKKVKVQAAIDL